ncbi:hypothetical protein HMPREF0044_0787 [Gleimia coleocanis DSM 15436]|uniref:Lipoprotein n=1 Tax=Gleimia coleocanis DSM 15436 TaxID=525245 RepID=C0VZQ9_9ACTO|nr:hypothetical protein HMPREF0044_0787 [Gleimia coleocanis DSM 15436]
MNRNLIFSVLVVSVLITGCAFENNSASDAVTDKGSSIERVDKAQQETLSDLPEVIVDADGKRSFPPLTMKEIEDASWEQLVSEFEAEGATPPARPTIQFVEDISKNRPEEKLRKRLECLHAKGWTNTFIEDGSIVAEFNTSTDALAYQFAGFECEVAYFDGSLEFPDETAVEQQWENVTNKVIPCLQEAGFAVKNFPSKKTYTDYYFATKQFYDVRDYSNIGEQLSDEINACEILEFSGINEK